MWKQLVSHWEWISLADVEISLLRFCMDLLWVVWRRDTSFTFAVIRSSVQFHGARERPFAGGGWEKFKSPGLRSTRKKAKQITVLSFFLFRTQFDGVNVRSVGCECLSFRGFFAMVVGKRFLCVSGEEPLEPAHIASWSWRAGVIRAVTHRDHDNPELTVRQLQTCCEKYISRAGDFSEDMAFWNSLLNVSGFIAWYMETGLEVSQAIESCSRALFGSQLTLVDCNISCQLVTFVPFALLLKKSALCILHVLLNGDK